MLYGAPIWGQAVNISMYVAKIYSSYTISMLRVACSYRTVAYDVICVISSMILAQEQADLALLPEKNVESENTIKQVKKYSWSNPTMNTYFLFYYF